MASQNDINYLIDSNKGRLIEGNYAVYVNGKLIAQGAHDAMFKKCAECKDLYSMILVDKQVIKNMENLIIEEHILGEKEIAI